MVRNNSPWRTQSRLKDFPALSTAGALGRAKETGVQKVLGAKQSQLIGKFFSESLMLCFFAMVAALILVSMILPLFNQLADTRLTTALLVQPLVIFAIAGLLLLLSVVAGLYPAIERRYLCQRNPATQNTLSLQWLRVSKRGRNRK